MREGKDITLVGWGAQLAIMEQACDEASKVCFFARYGTMSCSELAPIYKVKCNRTALR